MIVGVNRFEEPDERPIEILKIDQALEHKQIERVRALRARRDADGGRGGPRAAQAPTPPSTDRNLMPAIVEASRAYVTMGEMCDALREVWGTWRETPVF